MKQLIIILISIGCALFSLAQDQPKAVGELVSKRDKAFKKANETFMVKVGELQRKYTKNGDVERAIKLAALINDSAGRDYKSYPSAARGFAVTRDKDFKRINEIFIRELVKLQGKYTTSGDFENAKKVAALISESVDKADKESSQNKVFTLDGKWRFKFERGKYVMREFKGKYLIDENGSRHKVTKLGEFLQIDFGGGAFERVELDPEKPNLLEGVNYHGNKFKYERVK
ncbi:hypothetical protein N9A78_03135 [Akkermansiaceae bacterium]|nr:hypothetical protein [Akkermansiaceae bacterium]